MDRSDPRTPVGVPTRRFAPPVLVRNDQAIFAQVRTASTGSSLPSSALATAVLSLLAIYAPTGVATVYDFALASRRLSQIPYYNTSEDGNDVWGSTLRSRIRRIQDTLAVSISELASIFEISRQAVYKWLRGGTMSNLNQERLEDISTAANILAPYSEFEGLILSRRHDAKGNTLLMALKSGTPARTWAEDISHLLQAEDRQRKHVNRMISTGRPRSPGSRELGVPLLDESLD